MRTRRFALLFATAAAAGLSATHSFGQTTLGPSNWTSTTTGVNSADNGRKWNIAANWNTAAYPTGIGAVANFPDGPAGAARDIAYGEAIVVGTLNVTDSTNFAQRLTGSATIGGGSITFDEVGTGPAHVTVDGTGTGNLEMQTVTINDNTIFTVNQTSASSAAGGLNFTGEILGTGGFTKAGDGIATFGSATKKFAGATNVTGGRLRMSVAGRTDQTSSFTINGGQVELLTTGTYTLGTSASVPLNLNGAGPTTGPMAAFPGVIRPTTNIAATVTNVVNLLGPTTVHQQGSATGSLTFSGKISGTGPFTLTPTLSDANLGKYVLSNAANDYTDGTVLNGGTLDVTAGSLGSGPLTVNTNAFGGINSTVLLNTAGTTTGSLSGTNNSGGAITINNQGGTYTVIQTTPGTFPGKITGAGGFTLGTGSSSTLTLTGANDYTGATTVQAGKLVLSRLNEANAVSITGGTLQVADSSPTLPSTPSGNNASVSRPASLSIANNAAPLGTRVYNGTLDLGNNDLIIDYSATNPAADIEDMVRSGYNGGTWTGAGITSSTAANVLANGNYALAVADNNLLTNKFGDGTGGKPQFSGQNVDDTTVLVKFTHRVDLDLDGLITPNDAIIFATNYIQNGAGNWITGDVDYDRLHTQNDAIIFATFYNGTLPSLPEPGIATVALGAAGLLLRRGRRA